MKTKIYCLRNRNIFMALFMGLLILSPAFDEKNLPSVQAYTVGTTAGESVDCQAGTEWRWTRGPDQPDASRQAESSLNKEGITSAIIATGFGEEDGCGNFKLYATDFTVKIKGSAKLSSAEQRVLYDKVMPALSSLAKPKLGNVRIEFESGASNFYPGSPSSFNAPSRSSGDLLNTSSLNRKVYLLVYDPILKNGQRLSEYMGWYSYETLVQSIIGFMQSASRGQMQYSVVYSSLITNEWPVKIDGFRYTEETYLAVLQNQATPHSPDTVDYDVILEDPRFDLCGKLNRGEIDELWMYAGPYIGFYESRLVGPNAYEFNSPPVFGTHNCNSLLPIMGLNYERGLPEAIESFGHRTEATMSKTFGSWSQNRTLHNWDRFGLVKTQSPDYSYSGCGSIHYSPNSTMDYEHDNPTPVLSNCDDFRNYPNLSDPLTVAQPVTCTAWNCNFIDYFMYWYGHFPSVGGCTDAVGNNWWQYFSDPDLALNPSLFCLPFTLTVNKTGTGSGTITSNPAGINCGSDCSEEYAEGTQVTLSAFPDHGSSFVGWSGDDCSGTNSCTLTMDSTKNVTASFQAIQTYPGETTRISISSSGAEGNSHSFFSSMSNAGRYVAFQSDASNLVNGDTNGDWDIFLRDRQTGTTTRVSIASDGSQANGTSDIPSISGDGRYVVFSSSASNLVNGDTNQAMDIFIRDTQTSTISRVSLAANGNQGNSDSNTPSISADGRYVIFESNASNLVTGDTNGKVDVFVRDLQANTTIRVSIASDGSQANNESRSMGFGLTPSISASGRYVAFASAASNLVSGDTNGLNDIFLRDTQANTTIRVSVASNGTQATGGDSFAPSLSNDGHYIAFGSSATNLVAGDTNASDDIFVRDLWANTTRRISVATNGSQGTGSYSAHIPSISGSGRYVAFTSGHNNLVNGDTNKKVDVFLHDLSLNTTTRISVASDGTQGNDDSSNPILWTRPSISYYGQFVAFASLATNLVNNDANGMQDIFIHENSTFTGCATQSQIPTTECEALLALYNSTGGTNWINHTDWLKTNTPCDWFGVWCSNSHVMALVLADNNLAGTLPPALGNLSNLYYLAMPGNQLTGPIPGELGNIATLIEITLNNNHLTGSIPSNLGNLTHLVILHLYDNQLTGSIPSNWGNLTNLKNLDLSGNQLTGPIPDQLGSPTNLEYVSLDSNQLTGSIPSSLGNMTNLVELRLDSNKLTGEFPASIINLTNLTIFTFDCWITSTDPAVIAFLNNHSPDWQSKVCPMVLSVSRVNANPTNATSVKFTIKFSEAVTGVNTTIPYSDFSLNKTGITGTSITDIQGSGQTYTVTVNTGSGNGTLRLDVVDDNTIINAAGNSLGGPGLGDGSFNSGETYTISKGSSFADVPTTHPYFQDIEILYANGLTGGCGTNPLRFCPDQIMNRAQAAVFMVRGAYGAGYVPKPAAYKFKDDWSKVLYARPWAEAMRELNLTTGCKTSPLLYCPLQQLNREQAVIFGLKMKYGNYYLPPPATGTVFADMTNPNYWAAPWVEKAYADGLITACGTLNGKPKFCPSVLVSRGLGAYIIVRAKNLTMP